MSKGENFIHLKFEHDEAVNSKKDLLSSEIDLINIMKSLERYMKFRDMELKLRARFFREMKKIGSDVKKLESNLPEFELPKILKRPAERKKELKSSEENLEIKSPKANDFESQLREIQRKLKELSG